MLEMIILGHYELSFLERQYSVEPLYKGEVNFLASIERCPYLRGRFVLKQTISVNYNVAFLARESVLTSGVVVKRGSTV